MAKSLMFVGTSSHVGKSILTTAFCRILSQDGYRVAPFKAQNMSLNSAVTPSGREIGRAQAVQAEACGLLPNEHMNPVLLKPTGHMASQVIVQGRPVATRNARDYFHDVKNDLWNAVVESYHYLADRFDLVVLEGAGSPVEVNLKHRDIANMKCAEMADASVILVADIDRGGVFASVVGTIQLLEPHERDRVKGILINKFRGDASLFEDGRRWLESNVGIPVLGVIPYIPEIGIDEEDSVGLDSDRYKGQRQNESDASTIGVAIVQLPYLSNFTDFDPLFLEPDVHPFFCTSPGQLSGADVVVLPGTKSTIQDLLWLHEGGWTDAIRDRVAQGMRVLGICGGYQMLGNQVRDPFQMESLSLESAGLGLIESTTTIGRTKRTVLAEGVLCGDFSGIPIYGYEIHMGTTENASFCNPFAQIYSNASNTWVSDGSISNDGRVIGTYLHGVLHNPLFRTAWLNAVRRDKGMKEREAQSVTNQVRMDAYDRLADIVRSHVNMQLLYRILDPIASHDVDKGTSSSTD